jgi:3',5'-cyclic AMP phosphodiesterase CpdA
MDATCPCRGARPRGVRWARVGALLAVALLFADLHPASDPRLVVGPYLRDVTVDAMTIAWETEAPEGTAVEYGTEEPLAWRAEVAGRASMHAVRLTGLPASSAVFYRIVPARGEPCGPASATHRAQLDRGPGAPVTFAVVGDTQDQCGAWGGLAERIRAERPAFVLHVGDIVEEGNELGRWRSEFFAPARRLFATTPVWAVLGNHEADSPLYYRYFGGPPPGWRQSFVFGDAECFLVDSERDLSPGSEQYVWLDRALARSGAGWRFVAVHRPPFTSDRDEYGDTARGGCPEGDPRTRPLVPLLEAHGVDVLFCGHVHAYERSQPVDGAWTTTGLRPDRRRRRSVGRVGRHEVVARRGAPSLPPLRDGLAPGRNDGAPRVRRRGRSLRRLHAPPPRAWRRARCRPCGRGPAGRGPLTRAGRGGERPPGLHVGFARRWHRRPMRTRMPVAVSLTLLLACCGGGGAGGSAGAVNTTPVVVGEGVPDAVGPLFGGPVTIDLRPAFDDAEDPNGLTLAVVALTGASVATAILEVGAERLVWTPLAPGVAEVVVRPPTPRAARWTTPRR